MQTRVHCGTNKLHGQNNRVKSDGEWFVTDEFFPLIDETRWGWGCGWCCCCCCCTNYPLKGRGGSQWQWQRDELIFIPVKHSADHNAWEMNSSLKNDSLLCSPTTTTTLFDTATCPCNNEWSKREGTITPGIYRQSIEESGMRFRCGDKTRYHSQPLIDRSLASRSTGLVFSIADDYIKCDHIVSRTKGGERAARKSYQNSF